MIARRKFDAGAAEFDARAVDASRLGSASVVGCSTCSFCTAALIVFCS
jgi:hypothetical protein